MDQYLVIEIANGKIVQALLTDSLLVAGTTLHSLKKGERPKTKEDLLQKSVPGEWYGEFLSQMMVNGRCKDSSPRGKAYCFELS